MLAMENVMTKNRKGSRDTFLPKALVGSTALGLLSFLMLANFEKEVDTTEKPRVRLIEPDVSVTEYDEKHGCLVAFDTNSNGKIDIIIQKETGFQWLPTNNDHTSFALGGNPELGEEQFPDLNNRMQRFQNDTMLQVSPECE